MSKSLANNKMHVQKTEKKTFMIAGLIAVVIIGFIVIKIGSGSSDGRRAESGDFKREVQHGTEIEKKNPSNKRHDVCKL